MSKKYYWLKLQENFFDDVTIKMIEDMDNGVYYTNFFLKLCLKGLHSEGKMMFRDAIPYNEKMLSVLTGVNIDIVRSAMKVLLEFGMIEMWPDGTLYMNEVQKMIGSESDSAKRVRKHRDEKGKLLQCNTSVTKSNTEKEKEKEKEEELKKENKNTLSIPSEKTIKKITKASDDLEFMAFYNRYNHKKGKDQAFKAWKKLNKADRIEAFEKVEHYFSTIKEGISKVHPSTYLNNKRWTDEVSHDTTKPRLSTGVNNLKDILQDTQMQNLEIYNEPQTLALGDNYDYR